MVEKWLPVIGFEGLYEVSDLGRIRSLPRYSTTGRIMSTKVLSGIRYENIGLCKRGITYRRKVHHLVLEAFVGSCPFDMEGCHNNDDKSDNSLLNLRWDTHQNNMKESWKNGRELPCGSLNGRSKLTEIQVRKIKQLLQLNQRTQKEISHIFGVSQPTINGIARGKNWNHVK